LTWERGGPSTVAKALTSHQAQAGHRVTVLTTDQGARHGEHAVQLPAAVTVERLKVVGPDRVAYAPRFTQAVRAHLRSADIVHVHSIFTYPVHVALREAKAAGVPVVLRPCGLLHPYSLGRSRWQKSAYLALWGRRVRRCCTAWHYTSASEANQSWPQDGSPRFVVPNGVEPAEYATDCAAARERVWQNWPALAQSPYIIFLGRLHAKKRLDVLLQAFLQGVPLPYKLVVAGPDSEGIWKPLAARWLSGPAAERVLRLEMVTGQDKIHLLAGASLFALPSEHENFGVAALEALAAGTAVLLSPEVDLAEAVRRANLGYTAPVEVAAWCRQLAQVLAAPHELEAISSRAPDWVRHHFAWSQIAADLVERYRWVIGGCRDDMVSATSASPAAVNAS
jgi:glycosyltransferase involved in cell wall biosynthesis